MGKINELLKDNSIKFKDNEAVTYIENDLYKSISHCNFFELIKSFADYLLKNNYKNERIAIIGGNKLEWLISFFSIFAYTGTAVLLNNDLKQPELDEMISLYEPKLIIYDDELNLTFTKYNNISFSEVKKISSSKTSNLLNDDHDGKVIMHTSGTSNKPKGVLLTEENLLGIIPTSIKRNGTASTDRVLVVVPLSHVYGLNICIIQFLSVGANVILVNNFAKLEEAFKETKPTCFPGVPLIFNKIKKKIMGKKLIRPLMSISKLLLKCKIDVRKKWFKKAHEYFGGNLRLASSAGSYISPETIRFFQNLGINLFNGYGLTETSGTVALNYPGEFDHSSVGKIMDMDDVKIIESDKNGIGEIVVKGPNVFKNYLIGDNHETFVDGYFKTGDLGYIRNDFLFITGRKKNVIIGSNSKTIYPEELEKLFTEEKNINMCKIIMQDDKLHATITTDSERETIQKVVDRINRTLPKYKNISSFSIKKVSHRKIKVKE